MGSANDVQHGGDHYRKLSIQLRKRIDVNGPVHPIHGPCWVWTGARLGNGYGQMNRGKRGWWRAHRLVYTEVFGPVDESLQVLHKCDNRICVRPEHLFVGTNLDNQTDMHQKGRGRKARGAGSTRLHGEGKVTHSEAQEMRVLRMINPEKYTYGVLSEMFNITGESVRLIIKGRYHNGSK